MGMYGADLIRGPVGMVIGLIVWLITFPLLLGAINGWYTQAVPAGVVSGERFDRVVIKGSHDNPEDAWQAVNSASLPLTTTAAAAAVTHSPVGTTAYKIDDDGAGMCRVATLEGGSTATGTVTAAYATYYTPLGSEVTTPQTTAVGDASDPETKALNISGCSYEQAGSVFGAGGLSGLIEIILQAAGLAPPIALLFALGTFGTSFLRNMGNHPILAAVLTVIGFLLLATLLNVFIPFVSDAFEAIDGNRFVMYDEGLGNVATVIGNFFGVVIVASIMTVAWQVLQSLRGRNAMSSAQAM